MKHLKKNIRVTALACAYLVAGSSYASVAHLVLEGGSIINGNSVDNIYSSADPLLIWNWANFDNVGTSSAPETNNISFTFLKAPWLVLDDEFVSLTFSTRELSTTLIPGVLYQNAERAPFASPGHAGFEIGYGHVGCNTSLASFIVDKLTFDNGGISQFSASFTHYCGGGGDPMYGTFLYDANLTAFPNTSSVPEPGTLALLGLGLLSWASVRRYS